MVVGTSLFQIMFMTANATFLQAAQNKTVDAVLALILLVRRRGRRAVRHKASGFLQRQQVRAMLALLVVGGRYRLAVDLVVPRPTSIPSPFRWTWKRGPKPKCGVRAATPLLLAVLVAGSAAIGAAWAQSLVADLSDHLIAITTGFVGTDVLLFGAIDGPGDVVVVVQRTADGG